MLAKLAKLNTFVYPMVLGISDSDSGVFLAKMEKVIPTSVFERLTGLVEEIAEKELASNFKNAAHTWKLDGSPVTEMDAKVQLVLEDALPKIISAPVLGEEMPQAKQEAIWKQRDAGIFFFAGAGGIIFNLVNFCDESLWGWFIDLENSKMEK